MKPRTYFGIAVLFPYILWGICALVAFLLSSQEASEAWNIVLIPVMFYAFGILFWFIPYTILVVGMWIWSRNKSKATLYKLAMLAPVLLSFLMPIEALFVSLPADSAVELTKDLLSYSLVLGGFSLVFGYLCVGIALGMFKFLQSKHLIKEEVPSVYSEARAIVTNA